MPKTWRSLAGRPIVRWSIESLLAAGCDDMVVVVAADRLPEASNIIQGLPRCRVTSGGRTRAASVRAGLSALSSPRDQPVLIHDAARPFVTRDHVARLLEALDRADGAILSLPVADTLKRGDDRVLATMPRDGLRRAQTPQAFWLGKLESAYEGWPADEDPTDDSAVMERHGGIVAMVDGDPMLMKLTYPEDFLMAEHNAFNAWDRVLMPIDLGQATGSGSAASRFHMTTV